MKEMLKKLRSNTKGLANNSPRTAPETENLAAKTIRYGDVVLPVINLNGLWALRKLMSEGRDDVEALVLLLWVLNNQHRPGLIDEVAGGVDTGELAKLASSIDFEQLSDYLNALEEMMRAVGTGK
jgi:hypothetical protein